jgi:hypothetical protein
MKKYLLLLLVFPLSIFSQANKAGSSGNRLTATQERKIDSLKQQLLEDSTRIFRYRLVQPYFSLDNKNTFINRQPLNFFGIRVGIKIAEKHKIAGGYYWMSNRSKKPFVFTDRFERTYKTIVLNYYTLFYEYTLIRRGRFELDIPFEIGMGSYRISLQDTLGALPFYDRTGNIFPIGIGTKPVYRPWKWMGMFFLLGFRAVIDDNSNQNFNGLYYSFGGIVDVRQMTRELRYRGIKKKRFTKQVNQIKAEFY